MRGGFDGVGFLSRAARSDAPNDPFPAVGPGAYAPPSSVQRQKPSFTPFSTTTTRADPAKGRADMPGPGVYDPPVMALTNSGSRSNFVSTSKRFDDSNQAQTPGPGQYSVEEKRRWKSMSAAREPTSPIVRFDRIPSAPSVPMRHQSYGYSLGANGELVLQKPATPGYTGVGANTVGPGDYGSSPTYRTKGNGAAGVWAKFASRDQLPAYDMKKLDSASPGPGSYEQPSAFERTAPETFIDFTNVKRNKYSSSFQSNSERAFAAEMKYKASLPGPGRYQLPSTMEVRDRKPPEFQCFNSSSDRFNNAFGSKRTSAPPVGEYNPPISDFDAVRLKALKKRLLTQRSPWASAVSFGGGDTRFKAESQAKGPAPGDYQLGSTLQLKKSQSNAVASFGSTADRFREKPIDKSMTRSLSSPESSGPFMRAPESPTTRVNGGQRYNFNAKKKKPQRELVKRLQNHRPRVRPPDPVGPAPGAYDCRPKWGEGGGMRYREPSHLPTRHDTGPPPGPGDYDVAAAFSMGKNVRRSRTNVMISTSARYELDTKAKKSIPGPGTYGESVVDPSWVKPSYNILIAEQAARARR